MVAVMKERMASRQLPCSPAGTRRRSGAPGWIGCPGGPKQAAGVGEVCRRIHSHCQSDAILLPDKPPEVHDDGLVQAASTMRQVLDPKPPRRSSGRTCNGDGAASAGQPAAGQGFGTVLRFHRAYARALSPSLSVVCRRNGRCQV